MPNYGKGLILSGSGIDYAQNYQLFANFAPLTGSGLSISGCDTANWLAILDPGGVLSFQSIPEPSTWLLLALGCIALIILSRVRSSHVTLPALNAETPRPPARTPLYERGMVNAQLQARSDDSRIAHAGKL